MARRTKNLTAKDGRILNARRDTIDFRDLMYEPTLVEVPPCRAPKEYRKVGVPVLDQGTEGACTGYGLATVVNYLHRTGNHSRKENVSPDMLYRLARRYSEDSPCSP
jgi:hypothetical protein